MEPGLLPRLAEKLTEEFGRGFDASNLHKMKQFYVSFPILDALRLELNWTHYRLLLRVDSAEARKLDALKTHYSLHYSSPVKNLNR